MNEKITKVAKSLGKATGEVLMRSARSAGKFVYDHRHEAFGATVGMTKGTINVMGDLYGHTRTESDFNEKIEVLRRQSEEFRQLHEEMRTEKSNREVIMDSLGITYVYMDDYVFVDAVPQEVAAAYEDAFPNLANHTSLTEAMETMTDTQLAGMSNAIKGKLFEQRYVEYLNDGNLPDGYEAVLATSPTNPGWDIAILDEDGNIDSVLQAKATSSLEYVQEALERYPDVQVVTTQEVYSHLAMHGMGEHVIDSGISNIELSNLVERVLETADDVTLNLGPPLIPALIIGYSVYRMENLTGYEKGEEFGKRYVESYLAGMVGGMTFCVSGLWVLGLAAALGSKYCLSRGRKKRILYSGLVESIEHNQKIIDGLKRRMAYG